MGKKFLEALIDGADCIFLPEGGRINLIKPPKGQNGLEVKYQVFIGVLFSYASFSYFYNFL